MPREEQEPGSAYTERFGHALEALKVFQGDDDSIPVGESELSVHDNSVEFHHPSSSLETEWATVYSMIIEGEIHGAAEGKELVRITSAHELEAMLGVLERQVEKLSVAKAT